MDKKHHFQTKQFFVFEIVDDSREKAFCVPLHGYSLKQSFEKVIWLALINHEFHKPVWNIKLDIFCHPIF